MNLTYPINLEHADEGGFVVTFPDVPESITQGEDEQETLLRAVDALETALEMYVDERLDIPAPSKARRGQRTVSPSTQTAIKLCIYQTMRDGDVRKSDLARRLGWHMPQIDRLLDFRHASRLEQVDAALAALGKRVEVRVD